MVWLPKEPICSTVSIVEHWKSLQGLAGTAPEAHRQDVAGHPSSTPTNSTQPDLQASNTGLPSNSCAQMPACRFLELCVNTGEYEISLAEIRIQEHGHPAIRSDGELFCAIRAQYEASRYCFLTHKLRLFKPARVDYVEVSKPKLTNGTRVRLTRTVLYGRRNYLYTSNTVGVPTRV